MQALVGENNCGKSNILSAIDAFLSAGSGGVTEDNFFDKSKPIEIKCVFSDLNKDELKIWKKYLTNQGLTLIKVFTLTEDEKTQKKKIETEFHGFSSEPTLPHLSLQKIEAAGAKTDWTKLVSDNSLPAYFLNGDKATKASYTKGLERYLLENEVSYDTQTQTETHALGLKSNVIANLPKVFTLPAITNYKDETDSRKTNSIFNRLMAEITQRILKTDPKYVKLEEAITTITQLFNPSDAATPEPIRFEKLDKIEIAITQIIKQLMPAVESIKIMTAAEEIKSVLTGSIEVHVNDGVSTEVIAKGHGLQRCLIFSMLQALIKSENGNLLDPPASAERKSILLIIEEPELYIHSQLRRLFFDTLEEFSKTDQVIFSTHSSDFIDISNFYDICIVKKESVETGTKILTAKPNVKLTDEKKFKILTKINPSLNEVLFSKKIILVEGPEDKTAVVQCLIGLGKIKKRAEEIGFSIIECGGKKSIPDVQRILTAFDLPYRILHDLDIIEGQEDSVKKNHEADNSKIKELIGNNKIINFDPKLESILNRSQHFSNQYDALTFLMDTANHTEAFKTTISSLIEP